MLSAVESMRVLDTSRILKSLDIPFTSFEEEGDAPEVSEVTFADYLPQLANHPIGSAKMYRHQLEALNALERGKNVILVSGTGSGKTEAWCMYALKSSITAVAVYPTLALSHDQLRRLSEYYSLLGRQVVRVDREVLEKGARVRYAGTAPLLVTNPAFLMNDIKRVGKRLESYLLPIVRRARLFVFDEFDFYSPRCASLILSMLGILRTICSEVPQVAILTATLRNASEVGRKLSEVTGRDYVVIRGRAFRVRNRVYVLESPALLTDILRRYVEGDEGVTLVFTPSINSAERLYRKLLLKLPSNMRSAVAVHHHFVPKKVREDVEERMRKGEVKVVFSPKTLAQGIDVPNVVRVVHYGLPQNIREYLQREGRKGRRGDIPFTETIIVPLSVWERALVDRGVSAVKKWVGQGPEIQFVNVANKYCRLFEVLYKLYRHLELSREEVEMLRKLKLVKTKETLFGKAYAPSDRADAVWNQLGFYEYGPPYGIPRIIVSRGERTQLEPVSRRDMVTYFQPGAIDIGNEAIVIEASYRAVIEAPVEEAVKHMHELRDAIEQYAAIKYRLGEVPDISEDISRGRVWSYVEVEAEPIGPFYRNFGMVKIVPRAVYWVIEAERVYVRGRERYRYFKIELQTKTCGQYVMPTYFTAISMPGIEQRYVEWGAATLAAALRACSKTRLDTGNIAFTVYGDMLIVWEPDAAGILDEGGIQLIEDTAECLASKSIEPEILEVYLMQEARTTCYDIINEFGSIDEAYDTLASAAVEIARRVVESVKRMRTV